MSYRSTSSTISFRIITFSSITFSSIALLTMLFSFNLYAEEVAHVNCDNNERIVNAINAANGPTEIHIHGTCYEVLEITKNDITINGGGTAIIKGVVGVDGSTRPDLVTVNGATRVTLKALEVTEGHFGLRIINGANVTVADLKLTDHTMSAILMLNNSSLTTSNIYVMTTGSNGIDVQSASNLIVANDLKVSGSGTFGLNLQDGSVLKADKATIDFSRNLFGTQITVGSTAFINESSLTADHNILAGISVDSGSTMFAFSTQISASGNFLDGINCNTNSNVDIDATSIVKANNNGRHGFNLEDTIVNVFSFFQLPGPVIETIGNKEHGIFMELGAKLDIGINSSLISTGNGKNGLFADDGSTVKLRDSTITDNQTALNDTEDREHQQLKNRADVLVTFGSRISFDLDGNIIGHAFCDKSSISRGNVRCRGRD